MPKTIDGSIYVPYEERSGGESIVFFTRDLSSEGLNKVYQKIKHVLHDKVAIKLHTGEKNGPNIIPRSWVKDLMEKELPNGTIVETNTYYEGDRYTTEQHRETLKVNGWASFTTVDITDEFGTALLPVHNGKWFSEMSVGKSLPRYNSFLALTHFKGHMMGGFGGSNKNIGIGCADGREGKKWIHTREGSDNMWSIAEEELHERFTECTKAVVDRFKGSIAFINVMRNMSVDCDCAGIEAADVVTPDVGILASLDICALDTACIDIVFAMPDKFGKHLQERITSRHGLRQLSYMKEIGLGNTRYVLIDLDNNEKRIFPKDLINDLKPWKSDGQK